MTLSQYNIPQYNQGPQYGQGLQYNQGPQYSQGVMASIMQSTPAPESVLMATAGSHIEGVLVNEAQLAQVAHTLPHYVHVPVFRHQKKVYVKKQAEGCCGTFNTTGYFDKPGGFACFPLCNVDGCCDREMVLRVDASGDPFKPKSRKPQYRHPWQEEEEDQ
ncbi:hypothetical protein GNI_060620 [Gregarina niphandrodes]|uniref:Uncharacterized protein n=1 Tax=Gregarina niphandrodes TaxID=110365 RepID=A0A023B8F3_GRENI|nr:hypothetical protein GNI_060620 [Gregarina niphandrodes]EZG68924.1 hypothetical protein GNI_060620 [Gregarina niphandrodes]|eukprot:XP_011134515.1 hypothetical protein GNI_060620 [Gregarina niphandrodes]